MIHRLTILGVPPNVSAGLYTAVLLVAALGALLLALPADGRDGIVTRFGIDPARPIITQVSRFDRFKDPLEVALLQRQQCFECCMALVVCLGQNHPLNKNAALAKIRVAARKTLGESVIACGLPHLGRGDLELGKKETGAMQEKVAGLRRFGAAAP